MSEPASQRGIAFIALQSSQPLTTKTREWQTYRLTKLLFVVLRCAGPESTLARLLSPGPFFATCSSRTQKKKGFVCGYTDTLCCGSPSWNFYATSGKKEKLVLWLKFTMRILIPRG